MLLHRSMLPFVLGSVGVIAEIPSQIHLALGGNLDQNSYIGGRSVCWFTVANTTSTVKFGSSPNSLDTKVSSSSPPKQYLNEEGAGFHHCVRLMSLQTRTEYFYKVGSEETDEWSDVKKFTTFSNSPDENFTVAVFGDMGYLGSKERKFHIPAIHGLHSNWSAVPTRALLESFHMKQRMDMMFIAGDISYADDAYDRSLLLAAQARFRCWRSFIIFFFYFYQHSDPLRL